MAVFVVGWAARAAVIATLPALPHSADVDSWELVAGQLRGGENPYATTSRLNWPPFWMTIIYAIDHVTRAAGISFLLGLQVLLIAIESLLIIAVHRLVRSLDPARQTRRLLILGFSLNPVAILLVCKHGNFDVLVGLLVTVGVSVLVSVRSELGWLAASAAFGAGALVKTVPLVLTPLLIRGARSATALGRVLGFTLLLGPIILGLGVIYVLAPEGVWEHVIKYRSLSGFFGITGLLDMFHLSGISGGYQAFFPMVALAGMGIFVWLAPRDPRRVVLAAAVVLVIVPTLGPAYAPQYAYWSMPLLVASYPMFDRRWRTILVICYVVAIATYMTEYALLPSHGQWLVSWFPEFESVGDELAPQRAQTLLRLPLFGALLWLVAGGLRRAFAARPHEATDVISET